MPAGDNVTEIRAIPQPNCAICNAPGLDLHPGLHDRLFGSNGSWSIVRCSNDGCGMAWLNPMPLEDDIELAYKNYYTHDNASNHAALTEDRKERGIFSTLARLTGLNSKFENAYMMYIGHLKPGRLLEVGCGNGQRLAKFSARGWDVIGQEVDPSAAQGVRKRYQIDVLEGPLKSHRLPAASFDAIIMNHVIEHLHQPLEIIQECRRLLKPGGCLSVITPNIDSFGHALFGENWRPLEPPRHLYIYSILSLDKLLEQGGFDVKKVRSTAINSAGTASQGSYRLWYQARHGERTASKYRVKLLSHLFRLVELTILLFRKNAGEECTALCQKTNHAMNSN